MSKVRLRLSILLVVGVAVLVVAWLVVTIPRRVDLAEYAPSEALLYIECNDILAAATALRHTSAGKLVQSVINEKPPNEWLLSLARWTGLGRAEAVIASRAQVAIVVTNINTVPDNETLRIKPEFALIVETHTSPGRTKPIFEQILSRFAQSAYGNATLHREVKDGIELLTWIAPDGRRRITMSIQNTVLTIANSESAVQTCLDVRGGKRNSLKANSELMAMRHNLSADQALTFGFAPSNRIGDVAAIAIPLITQTDVFTSLPDDLLQRTTGKFVGAIGWASSANSGHIEDRYHLTLTSAFRERLISTLQPTKIRSELVGQLATRVESISVYCYESPYTAWQGLEAAVLSQLDALSAVMFQSFLRSVLLSYSIDKPEQLLRQLGREVYTVRATPQSERALIVAEIGSNSTINSLLGAISENEAQVGELSSGEMMLLGRKELAVGMKDRYLIVGTPADVALCLEYFSRPPESGTSNFAVASRFVPPLALTVSKDDQRVFDFIREVANLSGRADSIKESDLHKIGNNSFAVTETYLTENGIERRTVSPVGQIGALVTLVASQ